MRELHLFAGIGGGILAGEMLGHTAIGAVENNPFCQGVLRKQWPDLPIHGDIRTFQGTSLRGRCDLVCGGFPCQDISSAGRGAGITGERSSLWFEMLRVVRDVEPAFVFVENSPMLRSRGLDVVLGGLASCGFDAVWEVFSAEACGAPHLRKRMWILAAHPDRQRQQERALHALREDGQAAADAAVDRALADADGERRPSRPMHAREGEGRRIADGGGVRATVADAGSQGLQAPECEELRGEGWWSERGAVAQRGWWSVEPAVGRVAHGVPRRVDRLKALGNAQVPLQAATAFRRLMEALR